MLLLKITLKGITYLSIFCNKNLELGSDVTERFANWRWSDWYDNRGCDYCDYYENVDPGSDEDLGFTEEYER